MIVCKVCWCLVVQLDIIDDPASSGFTPMRWCIKCSPKLTGMFVVFLNVDDLHLLGVWGLVV